MRQAWALEIWLRAEPETNQSARTVMVLGDHVDPDHHQRAPKSKTTK
jgi:hypothetical protein